MLLSVNLARRLTSLNENDILGFSGYEDDDDTPLTKPMTQEACAEMAAHVLHARNLPVQCKDYKDIVNSITSRETDATDPTSLLS